MIIEKNHSHRNSNPILGEVQNNKKHLNYLPTNQIFKSLPTTFSGKGEVKGYKFALISISKPAFLYEVRRGALIHYEVFKRRVNHRYGNITYPGRRAFGDWAWTFMKLDSATRKFNGLSFPL